MAAIVRLVLGIVALIGILAAVAITLPERVMVARSVVTDAPETMAFSYLNDLHNFTKWSPWLQRDPNLAVQFSGPQAGQGATMKWSSGNKAIGTGAIAITRSNPPEQIDLAVDYGPVEGQGGFQVRPSGSGSKITWSFAYDTGSNPILRWKGLMLDRFIGDQYAQGLAKLKHVLDDELRPLDEPNTQSAPAPQAGTSQTPANETQTVPKSQ